MSRTCRLPGSWLAIDRAIDPTTVPTIAPTIAPTFVLAALFLIAPVLGLAQSGQREPEYRVEVLIVEPADPRSDAWPVTEPVRFEQAFDPRLAAALVTGMAPVWSWIDTLGPAVPRPSMPRMGLKPKSADAPDRRSDPQPVERPWAYIALDPLPPALAAARERVERTGEFSAVAALAWLQTAGSSRRPHPMRIHDDVVILRVEPEAADRVDDRPGDDGARRNIPLDARSVRLDQGPDGRSDAPRSSASGQRRPVGETSALDDSMRAREPGPDSSALEVPRPAQVTLRLDGTLALVQRQFLQADLDLHWRLVVQRPPAPEASADSFGEYDAPIPPQFEVHRLQQSRAIRPDRWEYFDSERFGVLLRVTALEPLEPLPSPEPAPANDPSALPADEAATGPANESGVDADRRRR